jgi:multidrug efflux pump subunit AcrB
MAIAGTGNALNSGRMFITLKPRYQRIILLIGIVRKNGIILVDFAIVAERDEHLSSYDQPWRHYWAACP